MSPTRDQTSRFVVGASYSGGAVSVAENWSKGPERDKGDRWEPAELGVVIRELLAKAEHVPVIGAR